MARKLSHPRVKCKSNERQSASIRRAPLELKHCAQFDLPHAATWSLPMMMVMMMMMMMVMMMMMMTTTTLLWRSLLHAPLVPRARAVHSIVCEVQMPVAAAVVPSV
jgi:hypothetical protein